MPSNNCVRVLLRVVGYLLFVIVEFEQEMEQTSVVGLGYSAHTQGTYVNVSNTEAGERLFRG